MIRIILDIHSSKYEYCFEKVMKVPLKTFYSKYVKKNESTKQNLGFSYIKYELACYSKKENFIFKFHLVLCLIKK